MQTTKCQLCGRRLQNEESVAKGYGPECADKVASFIVSCGTTEAELAELEGVGDGARWVRGFRQEMSKGSTRNAARCIAAARREAGHAEAKSLGLKDGRYFDYVNRRAGGDSAESLQAESRATSARVGSIKAAKETGERGKLVGVPATPPALLVEKRQTDRRTFYAFASPYFNLPFVTVLKGSFHPNYRAWNEYEKQWELSAEVEGLPDAVCEMI
ncbi:MAG TPA: DUF6011 domain-containing protein, partial [Blastocatellia bacterium]|nr:DUF6011 domain-containing protein [Blastocatellia bacterium]